MGSDVLAFYIIAKASIVTISSRITLLNTFISVFLREIGAEFLEMFWY